MSTAYKPSDQDVPSEQDWQKAESLHEFLEQFSEATKAFSADRHPTAHLDLSEDVDGSPRCIA